MLNVGKLYDELKKFKRVYKLLIFSQKPVYILDFS